MRLRRKRVEAAARQDPNGVDGANPPAPVRTGVQASGEGRLTPVTRMSRMGDAFAKRIAALNQREQRLLTAGSVILLVTLVIGLGVLPAWRSLQQGPARQQALNAQIARVAQLEAQAQALKSRPQWSSAEAGAKLQASSAGLAAPAGGAGALKGATAEPLQLSLGPQQANATLRALPADTLAAWLAVARDEAHAVPKEAKLTREPTTPDGADRWSGTLVMQLPP